MRYLQLYSDPLTGATIYRDEYTPNTERFTVASHAGTVYAAHTCLRCGIREPYALGAARCVRCDHLYLRLEK